VAGSRIRRGAVLLAGALLALVVVSPAHAATQLKGAGGDSPDPLIGLWQKAVALAPYSTPVDYSADGTGAGRSEWINGDVDFAVTSVPFTADEQTTLTGKKKTFVYVPFAAGSIAFLYHLYDAQGKSIPGLQFSGATLTGIFTGTITDWNDPAIAADNPSVTLPAKKIVPLVRGQPDGATYTATSFFRASAPAVWKAFMEDPQRNFPDEARELYPFFAGSDSRTSSFAVSDVVAANEGSDGLITYVDNAWAKKSLTNGADIAKIKNASGAYVLPTPAGTQAALAQWKLDATTHLYTPDYAVTAPSAYPVPIVNYLVVPTSGLSAEAAASLSTFAHYGLEKGQAAAAGIGDPALPQTAVDAGVAALSTALPAPTDTTTTTTTTAPAGTGSTDVSAADTSSGSSGDTLAMTGGPALAIWIPLGAGLALGGTILRRRATR
jgi:phosphate transport system substrate-binding protein